MWKSSRELRNAKNVPLLGLEMIELAEYKYNYDDENWNYASEYIVSNEAR